MASTTSRLSLSYPSGTDAEDAFVALDATDMQTLDNAAIWKGAGTLAAKPSASSVPAGSIYLTTDTGTMLLSNGSAWVWPFATAEAVGTVKWFSGVSHPADPDGVQRWHVCDGSALGRTAYPTLNSLYSTSSYPYGAGDGSTTFNLPNVAGRTLIGTGSGTGLTSRSVGGNGGEETHVLGTTEMPSHTHTATDSGHEHPYWDYGYVYITNTPNYYMSTIAEGAGSVGISGSENNIQTGYAQVTNSSTGGGASHNNMQPYMAMTLVVKIQ